MSDDCTPIEAADRIEQELLHGFLNAKVVAPGSMADRMLRTLIAEARKAITQESSDA